MPWSAGFSCHDSGGRKGRLVLERRASSLPMSPPLLSCLSSRKAASYPDSSMAGGGIHCRVKDKDRWGVSSVRVPKVIAVLCPFTKHAVSSWTLAETSCCLLLTSEGGQGMGCQGCEVAEPNCALRMFSCPKKCGEGTRWPRHHPADTMLVGHACLSAFLLLPTLQLAPTHLLAVGGMKALENTECGC